LTLFSPLAVSVTVWQWAGAFFFFFFFFFLGARLARTVWTGSSFLAATSPFRASPSQLTTLYEMQSHAQDVKGASSLFWPASHVPVVCLHTPPAIPPTTPSPAHTLCPSPTPLPPIPRAPQAFLPSECVIQGTYLLCAGLGRPLPSTGLASPAIGGQQTGFYSLPPPLTLFPLAPLSPFPLCPPFAAPGTKRLRSPWERVSFAALWVPQRRRYPPPPRHFFPPHATHTHTPSLIPCTLPSIPRYVRRCVQGP
jgi:hypothetical protein